MPMLGLDGIKLMLPVWPMAIDEEYDMEAVPNKNVASGAGPPALSSHVTVTVPVFASTTVKGYESTLIVFTGGVASAAEEQIKPAIAVITIIIIVFFMTPPIIN